MVLAGSVLMTFENLADKDRRWKSSDQFIDRRRTESSNKSVWKVVILKCLVSG